MARKPPEQRDPVKVAVGNLGYAVSQDPSKDYAELRRDVRAAALEAYVRRVVAEAPPLTPAQIDRIAAALSAGTP